MHIMNTYTVQHNNLHVKLNGKGKNAVLRVNKVKPLLKT